MEEGEVCDMRDLFNFLFLVYPAATATTRRRRRCGYAGATQ